MRIAIVEDLQFDFETLRDTLESCLQEQRVKCELSWFKTGELFLEGSAFEQYDLLFLDLLLGEGLNGMEVARAVRAANCRVPIVFITSERDWAVEGYEVQAVDYLIKPYEETRLQKVLSRVVKALQPPRFFTIPTGREQKCICADALMWAETRGHFVELHLRDGTTAHASLSFEDFTRLLPPLLQFQCCCRGMLVDLAYVDHLQGSDFLLTDGSKVPVSRSKRTEMQHKLADYAVFKVREEMGL